MKRSACLIVGVFSYFAANFAFADDESTQAGEHFQVICHFKNDEIAKEALKAAEAVWPIALELFNFKAPKPETPLKIHLYRTAADYEKAEAGLMGGRFRANLAFSEEKGKSSHIALQPECSDETLKIVGLNAQTRRLIVHEAAHLFRYQTIPNHASHPEWLATGAACWIDDEVMIRGGYSPGDEADPYTSTYLVNLRRLANEKKLPSIAKILSDEVDGLSNIDCYAVRWLLFRFMMTPPRQAQWNEVISEARRLGGGGSYVSKLYEEAVKILGVNSDSKLDEELQAFLMAKKPQWEQHYRTLEIRGDRWVQMAFPDTNAVAWRLQPAGAGDYRVSGSCRILPGSQQLNLLLGRNETGFISVALVAGFGVTAFEFHSRNNNQWERLTDAKIDSLKEGQWFRFRAEIQGGNLKIAIDDQECLNTPLRGRDMSGPWGVGVQAGCSGEWRGVKQE